MTPFNQPGFRPKQSVDLILATDNQKKDALTMFNGFNKSFEKTLFFRKREHWMLAWTRILPALLASRQWTLVAWMVHLDHICKLYELNKNRGNDYLVTFYEDRLRRHFHDRCARGEAIDLVAECGKTNENVMDTCKTKLQAVLQAAGLQDTSAHRQHSVSSDPAASAVAKQQAMWDAENRRLQNQSNAMKQREESFDKKVQALQQSQPNYSAGKFVKSWNSNNRSQGKGKGKQTSQRQSQWSNEERPFSGQKLEFKSNRNSSTGWLPANGKQKGKGNGSHKNGKYRSTW